MECLTALWLSEGVYNVDIKPGLITKVLSMLQIVVMYLSQASVVCYVSFFMPSTTMYQCGNSCPLVQLPASRQCLMTFAVDCDHCKAHMSILSWWTSESWDSIWLHPYLFCGEYPQGMSIPVWLLMVAMTMCSNHAFYSWLLLSVLLKWPLMTFILC